MITSEVHLLPIVEYQLIETDGFPTLPLEALKKLSKYSQDFYYLCQAVISGESNPNIASRQLGKCSPVRWLTPASRVLRLYMSEENPSENLILLVRYVVLVYGKTWFETKCDSRLQSGPLHLLKEIQRQTDHFSGV